MSGGVQRAGRGGAQWAIPLNLLQHLTQGRSRHAAVESEVKSRKIRHPEAKIKENHPNNFRFSIITRYPAGYEGRH